MSKPENQYDGVVDPNLPGSIPDPGDGWKGTPGDVTPTYVYGEFPKDAAKPTSFVLGSVPT